ncbi:MAG TPA: hypothetical protein VNK89_00780 [Thermoflexus sp.]|nr:hypothetical protein [Thermoflexus sp.]
MLGLAFASAAFIVIRRGEWVPCGCTGTGGDWVDRVTLARALTILGASLFILIADRSRPLVLPVPFLLLIIGFSFLPAGWRLLGILRERRYRQRRRKAMAAEQERLRRALQAPLLADRDL